MKNKFVYLFSEGNGQMRNLLGGKGANLAEMTNLGLPVPQGFVITTEACNKYFDDGRVISDELKNEISEYITKMEEITGKKLGDVEKPLLVSVRSGSRASMPGMMDTILNLGINDEVVESIGKKSGNYRFAYDSYRRFIQMFADVVMGLPKSRFEVIIDEIKEKKGVKLDTDLDADDLKEMVNQFKSFYREQLHTDFPTDPLVQLENAVEAVFKSWNNDRAIYYRRMNDIPSTWGTAVNVQEMVFGNMGNDCGTGVAFTRNPANGDNHLFGEFLMNAQGEDVVAGIRTPQTIDQLKDVMPAAYNQFVEICSILEKHYKDMQDMEFTIENEKLYMLQTRNGKRTANAALKIACDMVDEGLITKEQALMMVDPKQLDALLHPQFDAAELKAAKVVASGLPASPGAACGKVVFDAAEALEATKKGDKVILVRLETSPEDIEGMHVSEGILTARGGMTSHAAVVARGMGTCCVAGCGDIKIDEEEGYFIASGIRFNRGDFVSLDGTVGNVYEGKIKTVPASIAGEFEKFMSWADDVRNLGVMINGDTAADAAQGIGFGAEGIGLVRTEHMWFENVRIKAIREMILAKTDEERDVAFDKMLPLHRENFEEIFKVTKELPVTIRYLDPPLHEFLPKTPETQAEMSKELGISVEDIQDIVVSLHEQNPMMGHRGCRLAISYPRLAEMQTEAILQAAINVQKELGCKVKVELMVPLVNIKEEFHFIYDHMESTAQRVLAENNATVDYRIGTCMETPRSCLKAGEIAERSTFFSFGTNDLTQCTYGFSRDDAGKFLNDYYDNQILEFDPFQRMDIEGVGEMVEIGLQRGRAVRPDLKIGICGEHSADPLTIAFLDKIGFDYISCSPFLVPIARLAAAQAAINNKK